MKTILLNQAVPRKGYFVSAPWRSSGKTLVSMGLAAGARRRGLNIQTFKKGPDYIDPLWLQQASGNPCYNLDPYLQSTDELLSTFEKYSSSAMISVVEGTMGLHDGLATDGSDSNAAIARLLKIPVVLVVDCRGMHRTVAALIKGVQAFDTEVEYAGVILNRLRSPRHEDKICRAMAQYTDLKLIGAMAETQSVLIEEKELGLAPAPQYDDSSRLIELASELVEKSCNLDSLFECVEHSPQILVAAPPSSTIKRQSEPLKIGLARDAAFHFYYEDDLEALRSRGVQLIELSPLSDALPDDLDGLLLGGGFPERFAEALAANTGFRSSLNQAISAGLPVRAECAGLMYLCRSLELANCHYPMVGAIAGDVTMCQRPQGRGYVQLRRADNACILPAHEFHHSTITFDKPPCFEYRVARGYGVDGENDGVCIHNVLASYAHFRHTSATPWVDWFLDLVKARKYSEDSARHV